jgi:hypothetical protein
MFSRRLLRRQSTRADRRLTIDLEGWRSGEGRMGTQRVDLRGCNLPRRLTCDFEGLGFDFEGLRFDFEGLGFGFEGSGFDFEGLAFDFWGWKGWIFG